MYNLNCEILCPWVKGSKVSIDYRAIFFLINNQNSIFFCISRANFIDIYFIFVISHGKDASYWGWRKNQNDQKSYASAQIVSEKVNISLVSKHHEYSTLNQSLFDSSWLQGVNRPGNLKAVLYFFSLSGKFYECNVRFHPPVLNFTCIYSYQSYATLDTGRKFKTTLWKNPPLHALKQYLLNNLVAIN